MKNLVFCCVGDDSLHLNWFSEKKNYDLLIVYYGESEEKHELFKRNCDFFFSKKGEKLHLVHDILMDEKFLTKKYDFIWIPDCDISISVDKINRLFEVAERYNLFLCQPSMNGYVSHTVTQPQKQNVLRFTNFVEILAPLFNSKILTELLPTFKSNYTGHGLDFVWPKLLNYPMDRIAIIDEIVMTHTKPIGLNYDRLKVHPNIEFPETLSKFGLDNKNIKIEVYSQITR